VNEKESTSVCVYVCERAREADSRKIGQEITASDVPQGKWRLKIRPRLENGAANYEFSGPFFLLRAALFHLKQMTPCSLPQFGQICAAAKEAFRRVAAMKHSLSHPCLCARRKF
jgi:hypothetical protein